MKKTADFQIQPGPGKMFRRITGCKYFIIPLLTLLSSVSPALAGKSVTVGVLPFFVHSKEDIAYLGRALSDMLSTRLETPGEISTIDKPVLAQVLDRMEWRQMDEEQAAAIGRQLAADVVVTGSLTKIGAAVSLDVLVIDTSRQKPTGRLYATADTVEDIPARLRELARRLNLAILDKKIISDIIVTGNRFIERDAILYAIQTKPGDVFSPEVLQEDLKKIFQMGYFKDIQIISKDTDDGGMEITFQVKEKPMVRAIQIKGNKKIKLDDIQKVMETKPRTILDLNKVIGDVSRIKKLYVDKGYYNIEVSHKVDQTGEDSASVDFAIKEHKILKVKDVTFTGNDSIKAKELRKVMETRPKNWMSFFTSIGLYKDEALKKDTDRIVAYYYSKGFLTARVDKPRVEFKSDGIYVHFSVYEGERYTLGSVEFQGDLIFDTGVLRQKIKSAPGETFNGRVLNDDLVALKAMYAEKGYAYADVSPITDLVPEEKQVNLVFNFVKGDIIHIDKIHITGNTRTRDNVIRRELRLIEGDIYNSEEIKRSKQEVNNLGFFEEVNVNTVPGSRADRVDLDVEVKERPTGSFSIGAGYSSVDSIVGMFQLSQNNLFGKGQQLSLMMQLGGHSNYYNISFTEPWFRNTRTSVGFDLYNMEREYEEFDRDSNGLNLRASFPVADFIRFHLTYRLEDITIDVLDDDDVALDILKQEGSNVTSSITGTIVKDSRDDRWKPRSGVYHSLSCELAGLGGDSRFVTLVGSAAKFFPLPWDTAFMARGTIGQIFDYGGREVPISEKFFLGGLDSLRGFDVRSVGPDEKRRNRSKRDVVGGEKELFFNFEYLFPLIKNAGVRGVVFFDSGNAYKTSENFFSEMKYDAGFGIRWYSPFGPLRVEWGMNLNPKEDEDSSNFEFSMGRMF